ncbi:MAG: hypothetical protein ABIO58_04105 [Luteimonas sp.]
MRKSLLGLCILSALATPAFAADPPSADQRIAALEARIQAMEVELQQIKAQSVAVAPPTTAPAATDAEAEIDALAASPDEVAASESAQVAAPAGSTSSGSNPNLFNPAISIIINGSYGHHSLNSNDYVRVGFPLVGEGGPGVNGFSLGESEIAMATNIDDKFYGQLTLAVGSEDGLGIEEAFIDTTALPAGFSLRMGRFFSNIGYLNTHHTHTDNFFDRPLPYQAFLGGQYGDDGVQLRWVAPTAMFLEVGGELLRGQNFPSGGAQHGGVGTRTLFAHVGGDVGIETSWLAGVSMLKTKAAGAADGFSGDGTLYIADGTLKWAPQGNTKDGGITVRGEYFLDDRDGVFADPEAPELTTLWNGQRRGAYLEGVYRLNRRWDIGYRYDRLWADDSGPLASDFDPFRHSAELTWRNSEFSLVRLQLSHDKPNPDDSDNAVTVQYQISLGAHGAHKF